MNKIFAAVQLLRPLNIFQSIIAVFITAALFPGFPDLTTIILAAAVTSAFLAGGNAINDYFDYNTDLTNRPGRPLPSKTLTKPSVILITSICFIIGIILFIPVATRLSASILVINLILLIIYTPLLKPTLFFGNLTVSYLLGSVFLFASEIFGDYRVGIIPGLLAFFFNLVRELIKDMEDLKGDRDTGVNTIPVQLGLPASRQIAFFLLILIIAFCLVPYTFNIYGVYYLIAVIISVEIPLFFVLYLLLNSEKKSDFSQLSRIMKLLVFCGLLSIFLGKF